MQQDWNRIEEIFQEAVECPLERRPEFLRRACAGDECLRRELDSLLVSHESRGGFIESAIRDEADRLMESETGTPSAEMVGRRIGVWRITGLIGQGGMGSVYEAVRDDQQYRKQAAIKIVKGGMDTEAVLSRFRHERQILAGLEHPNIARLLDGGATDDGRPWFAMERIEGRSIVDYCDTNRLSIPERLQLFRQVCAAVQYAHQNLVVHRDIKPGNILVTADGVPKLLDFGIARVLEPGSADDVHTQTVTVFRMLTPDYASPEQVLGASATTSTDVYSLGAVLYELLAGKRAHRITGYSTSEIERAICRTDPEKPSQAAPRLKRKLAGDLDNIVLMAMRKEPQRRYGSVEWLSEDIRRHLAGLPVAARPDTLRYRTGKFVRRYRVGVTAASLVLLSLMFGIVASNYEARRAERRFNQVRGLAHAVLFDIYDEIEFLPGSTKARKLVVQTGLNYIDSLAHEARGDSSLWGELAGAYLRIGDVQGHAHSSNLGDTAGALASYRKAREMFETLVKQEPANGEFKQHLATLHARIGDELTQTGDVSGALENYRGAAALEMLLITSSPNAAQPRHDLASLQFYIGRALMALNDTAGAMEYSLKALAMHLALLEEHPRKDDPANARLRKEMSADHASIGILMARRYDLRSALSHFREGAGLLENLMRENPLNPATRRALTIAYGRIGDYLGNPEYPNLGDAEGARENYRKMLAIAERMAKDDAANKLAATDYAIALTRVGECTADNAEALGIFHRALGAMEKIAEADPGNARLRSRVALLHFRIGARQLAIGESGRALQSYGSGIAMSGKLIAADPKDMETRLALAGAYRRKSEALAASGDKAEAPAAGRQAIRMAEDLRPKDTAEARGYTLAAEARGSLAATYRKFGDQREACVLYVQSSEEWRTLKAAGVLTGAHSALADRIAAESARCAPFRPESK